MTFESDFKPMETQKTRCQQKSEVAFTWTGKTI